MKITGSSADRYRSAHRLRRSISAAIIAVACATGGACGQEGCGDALLPLRWSPPPSIIYAGTTADLDGDGSPELVLASAQNLGTYRLVDGVITSVQIFASGSPVADPLGMVAGDFDGDGDVDIATLGAGQLVVASLNFYRNSGGTLSGPIAYSTVGTSVAIAAGDLNGDGKIDIVTASRGTGSLAVYRGGNNGPLAPFFIGTSGSLRGVAVGDFDGDGDQDIAIVMGADNSPVSSLQMLRNDGAYSFTPMPEKTLSFEASGLSAGRFDQDMDDDLCVIGAASGATGAYALCYSSPAGLGNPQQILLPTRPRTVQITDLDGDGRTDLLLTAGEANGGSVYVRLGTGAGAFGATRRYWVGIEPTTSVVAQLDEDGAPDLVLSTRSSSANGCAVLKGRPDGEFAAAVPLALPDYASGLAIGDIDGDGVLDAVVLQSSSGGLVVLRGAGDDIFSIVQSLGGTPTTNSAVSLVDLDHDGDLDVLAHLPGYQKLVTYTNNGGGSFGPAVITSTGGSSSILGFGDVTGDSITDAVVTLSGSPWIRVFAGVGSGAFAAIPLVAPEAGNVSWVSVADINGDSRSDLVVIRGSALSWWEGDGIGGFPMAHPIATVASISACTVVDIDGDGDLDIVAMTQVTASDSGYRLLVLKNQSGSFAATTSVAVDRYSLGYVVSDMDNDGTKDVLVRTTGIPGIWFLRGHADGSFDPGVPYLGVALTGGLAVEDVDGDGHPDLVSLPSSRREFCVSFSQLCPVPRLPGDLDGDGRVNGADLARILGAWGPSAAGAPEDLDGNGVVNGADLALVLGAWTG